MALFFLFKLIVTIFPKVKRTLFLKSNLIKRWLHHRRFLVNFTKSLRTLFYRIPSKFLLKKFCLQKLAKLIGQHDFGDLYWKIIWWKSSSFLQCNIFTPRTLSWMMKHRLHWLFYKQLGSCLNPQSCLYFKCFRGSKLLNGCLVA